MAEPNVVLHQGDCLEIMKDIPDKSVNMILCDLPYGVTANSKDVTLPFDLLWEQYNRIITNNGCIALFAQGKFYIDLVNSNPKMFRYDLVWDKETTTGFLNARRMPLRQHEQIAIFYKSIPVYNPQYSQGIPLHSRGNSRFEKEMKNENYNFINHPEDTRIGCTEKFPTSILRFEKPHSSIAVHRTEKPVGLCQYLIKTYTNEGMTVLDNCMGSGTTGVACVLSNRKFIGIEIDEKYFQVAKKRIIEGIDRPSQSEMPPDEMQLRFF